MQNLFMNFKPKITWKHKVFIYIFNGKQKSPPYAEKSHAGNWQIYSYIYSMYEAVQAHDVGDKWK